MNRSLIICDRLMYGSLLAMIFFLPYSLAMIEVCQVTMMVAWGVKHFLPGEIPLRQTFPKGFNLASSSMGWSLLAIALLILLTVPFSHYPALSFKKFGSRFLQQIFLMYLVTEIICSRKRLYSVLLMLLLTLFFVSIDVMVQYLWGTSIIYHSPLILGRVSGPLNHPNDLGTLLVAVLPIVLVLIITCRSWIPLLFGSSQRPKAETPWVGILAVSILFSFLVLALGLTSSRGAWVAFVVSMIILGLCLKNYKTLLVIILMLAIFLGVFWMHCLSTRLDMSGMQGSSIVPQFTNLPFGYNEVELFFNLNGRESYWMTALSVIHHYPWFGCGYSAYVQTLKDMNVGHTEYPHNSLLHITAELGLVGLALYGWFFTALFLQIKNILRAIVHERDIFLIGCGVSSGILAWMIHGLMDTPWGSFQLSILLWLFIGIFLSLALISRPHKGEKLCP